MKLTDNYINYLLSANLSYDMLISNIFLPIYEEFESIKVAISSQTNELFVKNLFDKKVVFEIYSKNEILSQLLYIEQKIMIYKYYKDNKIEKMIKELLSLSILYKSSDIHIEPFILNDNVKLCNIRIRIDGLMYDMFKFPINILMAISSRIKLFATMDIVQKRIPQNGRFSLQINHKQIDFRVSSMPLVEYESIVIRILGKHNIELNLDSLGYTKKSLAIIKESILLNAGLILVCGATGSGKTTTLYSMINYINDGRKKIITIEDPVEYNIKNTQQVQIETEIDLTFEIVLKNILRQDPDVIVIGEIRDKTSLKIAIEASMTGHLVLATLHTNSVAESIARLYEMGIEPYFIASTLKMITVGRLLRIACKNCNSKGCKDCNYNGYTGRTIIEETLKIDSKIINMILKKSSQNEIKQYLKEIGFLSIEEQIMHYK